MAKIPEQLKQILEELGLAPQDATWEVRPNTGVFAVTHKALERVAAHKKITFEPPVMIEASAESKTVVMLVTGRMGDQVEWSIGEATPYNNKNGYPFAMAEKRAKDRVILKLINVAGDVYSEEEADDFKASRPQLAAAPQPAPEPAAEEPERSAWETWANSAMNKIRKLAKEEGGAAKLTGWFSGNMADLKGLKAADQQLFELLRAYYDEQYEKANTGERT